MRLMMVHNEYALPSGEETAAQAIAALMQSHGHQVDWLLKSSADVVNSRWGKIQSFFSGIHNPRARREMERLLRPENCDLVQVQNLYPQISPSILKPCRDCGIPVVMRCPNYRLFCPIGLHLTQGSVCERCLGGGREWSCVWQNCAGSRPKSLGYALRNSVARLTRSILDNVSVFIVLSEFQRQRFIAGGVDPERIEIVPNFDGGHVSVEVSDSAPGRTVAFVGRLSPEKGIADFIAAARLLPSIPFAVAGDPSHIPDLVRAAPANVCFHGFLSGAALDAFYQDIRMLVAPSRWFEGFPNTIGQAMACARPVIASRIGALPEIVEDNVTGLLFDPGNIPMLVDRIQGLYQNPQTCRAMGQAGRGKLDREYHPGQVYDRFMAVYAKAFALGFPTRQGERIPTITHPAPLPAPRSLN